MRGSAKSKCSEEACGRNLVYQRPTCSPFRPAVMVVRKRCIKATKLHLSFSSSFESVINYVVKVKSLKLTHLQKKINSLIVQSRSQGLTKFAVGKVSAHRTLYNISRSRLFVVNQIVCAGCSFFAAFYYQHQNCCRPHRSCRLYFPTERASITVSANN